MKLEFRNIVKEYPPSKALNNVSFSCVEGDIVGVLGPNGAGKTTLIRLCACLTRPTSGQIFLNEKIIDKAFPKELGVLSVDSYLYGDLTTLENLVFYAKLSKISKDTVKKYIHYFNLEEFKNKAVKELSFGQKKRVSIARFMLSDSKILLMDEPFLGLDLEATNELVSLIINLGKNDKIVLMTTHQIDIASKMINKLIVLKHGNLIHFGAFDGNKTDLQSFYGDVLQEG